MLDEHTPAKMSQASWGEQEGAMLDERHPTAVFVWGVLPWLCRKRIVRGHRLGSSRAGSSFVLFQGSSVLSRVVGLGIRITS